MNLLRYILLAVTFLLASCAANLEKGTLSQLDDVTVDLKDAEIEGGIEKAMEAYQQFLEETPETAMTPEALRRLADLKIEKEYGTVEGAGAAGTAEGGGRRMERPEGFGPVGSRPGATGEAAARSGAIANAGGESTGDFEKRAAGADTITSAAATEDGAMPAEAADLENAGAREAITLYQQLLEKYPLYPRNDQVLYQMSRAYEELGDVEGAMQVMNRIVAEYPDSRYMDEVQFRRGEYFFMRKKFLDAEEAYASIVQMGDMSSYYEFALYKLGWSYYKQELYEDGLHRFVALLDHKVKIGYDFENPTDEFEQKRVEDTYRVISLSFSYLGGPDAVTEYFAKNGARSYEVSIYSNLGEYYLDKRRYADAAASYKAFVKLNPYHKVSPYFDMRVIEIYKKGGFPRLVIEANKAFATDYGLKSEYWKHFNVADYGDVIAFQKTNLQELANYYHARYQDPREAKEKGENFQEALRWYREYLESFPKEVESPGINYRLADLLLENKWYGEAATEYENTAYEYPPHEKAAAAGYAAVYAHREHLEVVGQAERTQVKRDIIRSSLRFADTFPQHEKAALVMGAAVEDIYAMKDYEFAVTTGRKMVANFPQAEQPLRRSAWLVIAHSSYELAKYKDAEDAYLEVLALTAPDHESRPGLVENLAASIYKQGEEANLLEDYKTAADHFLRVGLMAPTAKIRPAADYDGATALIKLKDWDRSAEVLLSFRRNYPGHELQPEVTKKIAHVYEEAGKLGLAAAEYERIETESQDEGIRREALQIAADLYTKAKEEDKALQVYRRYVSYFPRPVEPAVETHNKIAQILKTRGDMPGYYKELNLIVAADANAGAERTDRTRYLAATASLELTEPLYTQYAAIKLTQPFEQSLTKKRAAMKTATDGFGKLVSYEVGDVTAAATYYIAEVYYNFAESLKQSERPTGMDDLEMEQYEELIDEQAYPFEEKAIEIHEKNLDLMMVGVYNGWLDKSLLRLASIMPGRYAKFEDSAGFIAAIDTVDYLALVDPQAVLPEPDPEAADSEAPADTAEATEASSAPQAETGPVTDDVPAEAAPMAEEVPAAATATEPERPAEPETTPEAEMAAEPAADIETPVEEAAPMAEDAPAAAATTESEQSAEPETTPEAEMTAEPVADGEVPAEENVAEENAPEEGEGN